VESVVAEAPVFHPPAFISDQTGFIAATFTADNEAWRLRLYHNDQPIETSITASNPYALQMYPASDGGMFAVWLDYTGGRASQLYVAHLKKNGNSELGAVLVTDAPAVRVSATPLPNGGLWLVWSTALIPESVLMVSQIDAVGRPRIPLRLTNNADYPALMRTDGRTWVYWLAATDRSLHRAELTDGQTLHDITRLTDGIPLESGDVLSHLSIGADTTHAYAFWQVGAQVWWTSGSLTAQEWDSPRRLSISLDAERPAPQTGFNSGRVSAVSLNDDAPIQWLLPAVGQSDVLPTSAVWLGSLGIVYWRGGQPFSGQKIDVAPRLIAPPAIAYDAERDLALAWWSVLNDTAASLHITYSRR